MTSGKTLLILPGGIEAAEMMVDDGQLKLTDFSAILSGFFCTQKIPRHTGVDFIGAAIRAKPWPGPI
jgi:hypothetical protein